MVYVFGGFIVWIAINNRFQAYVDLLKQNPAMAPPPGQATEYFVNPIPAIGFPGIKKSLF